MDIATDGQHLSAHRGFLLVERDGSEAGRVPLDDIHAVIVHAHGVTWSGSIVTRLAERGAPIVFCGANHSPIAVTLPLQGHHAQNGRMQAQWRASKPLMKQMWRRLVAAKIRMQGSLLVSLEIPGGEGLIKMAGRVGSGDSSNLEAQAARRYWPLLMGKAFRRDTDAAGANALLNYGYAIMRATCARAIVGAGLHPTIGIQHSNRGNAFALADDLVEPFRPIVDVLVRTLVQDGVDALNPAVKRCFARLIAVDLTFGDEVSPVSVAAQRLARSVARGFENGRPDLTLFEPPSRAAWAEIGSLAEGGAEP